MPTVNPSQAVAGDEITAAKINDPVNTLANAINGNLDQDNIKDSSVTTSKLANDSVTASKIADGATIETDGWTAISDSWSYGSATTITVPSDATTKYSVGDKIKLTQTTVKYFYITAVSTTTLTISGGTDYTLANAAISSPSYSKVVTPLGFPAWFNFTVTTTGWAATPTTAGRFAMQGRVVIVELYISGTSNATTATCTSLPVTVAAGGGVLGPDTAFRSLDNGSAASAPGSAVVTTSSTTVSFFKDFAHGSWTSSGTKAIFGLQLVYEAT